MAQDIDPSTAKSEERQAKAIAATNTYETVAREFHKVKADGWSEGHATKWLRMNEIYLFPEIGHLPLPKIKTSTLLTALRKVEAKGILSIAQDLQQITGQVFRYAVQTERIEQSPVGDLKGALKPHVAKHFAATLDPLKAGELLRAIDSYSGHVTTRDALKLSALFFQRPGNIRAMEWAWLDLGAAMLTIPPADMKRTLHQKANGKPHLIPLARQAVAILQDIQPLTGSSRFVFPSVRTSQRPMSDGTINAALRRLDFGSDDHVGH